MLRCYRCGAEWKGEPRPGFHATCAACEAYVYVCANCRFHDPRASSECQLANTEPVRHNDRPCFCEEFKFVDRPADWSPQAEKERSESARARFDRLFKKP
ncbi:MAG: hypothetical protein ACLF0G_16845 [Candidatus Brocadiia bacterium]